MIVRDVLDNLSIGYAQIDRTHKIVSANLVFSKFIGYELPELVGKSLSDISHPEEHGSDDETLRQLFSREIKQSCQVKKFVHNKGEVIFVEVVWIVDQLVDDSDTIVIVFKEQERKRSEATTAKADTANMESFDYLFMNNPQPMIIYSTATLELLNVNHAAYDLTGYTSDDLENFDLSRLFSEKNWANMLEFMQNDKSVLRKVNELTILTKTGGERVIESTSHLIQYQEEEARHVMINDITERKKDESKMKDRKSFILQSQVLGKMGNWEFDVKRDRTRWSDNIYELLGLNKVEIVPSFEYFMELVHPDDRMAIAVAHEKIMKDKKEVEVEHRIVCPDGRQMWMQNNIKPTFENGELVLLKGVNIDITQRKESELEVLRYQESLAYAQTIANMGSWEYDAATEEIILSENYYRLLKIEPGTVELTYEYFFSLIHPEDLHLFNHIGEELTEQQKQTDLEFRLLLPEDEIMWVQFSLDPITKDGKLIKLRGVTIDITERKIKELWQERKQQFEHVLYEISQNFLNGRATTTDPIITEALGKIGQFTQVDRVYIFQLAQGGAIMNNTHEWCNFDITPEIDNLQELPTDMFPWWMQCMRKREIINYQDILELPAEAEQEKEILQAQQIISILVLPLFFKGQLRGFIGFDSVKESKQWEEDDINSLKSLTDMIANVLAHRTREAELIRSKEIAEESSRLKSAFLATVSHELRTPLNPIIGFSGILPELTDDPTLQEIATTIRRSGTEMIHLLEDLFDLSLAQGHQVLAKPERVNCVNFYTIAWAMLEEILVQSGKRDDISLRYSDSTLSIYHEMELDQAKSLQVLNVLFKNAVKFTRHGEIEFGFRIVPGAENIELVVRDTGVGFDEVKKAVLFEDFRQGDDGLNRNYDGMGIGLSIAKKLTDIMGGRISAESALNCGSTFFVTLPSMVTENPNIYKSSHPDDSDRDLLRGKKILVVDDNRFIAEIIDEQLRVFELGVVSVCHGQEALDRMDEIEPDLILMDLYMPVMDGFKASQQIKAHYPDLPILAITAHAWVKQRYRAFHAGCEDVVMKPIYREILLHKIRQLLSKK
ncbi:PAS domain S-box protein [uncultured Sunxiuqinia sp.]|uniref:hybrid sensor histidine kinase/response regulator n=1 Tax=uncultured Sunxiuqinia sp. TaxID=1573825 RepID=UPI002AA90107|nr:PAS domain S-box protein [uncultured Sunxiuqinia sp.]